MYVPSTEKRTRTPTAGRLTRVPERRTTTAIITDDFASHNLRLTSTALVAFSAAFRKLPSRGFSQYTRTCVQRVYAHTSVLLLLLMFLFFPKSRLSDYTVVHTTRAHVWSYVSPCRSGTSKRTRVVWARPLVTRWGGVGEWWGRGVREK